MRSEAAAVILEKRPNFLATRESPGWRRRPESRAAKVVEEGADWPLRRRAPTTGFWEKAKGSKKEDQTRKKEAERDDLLANGEAIEAPVQDGAKLAAQGYWISPAFVLERRIRHVKGKRIYEEVKDRFCVNMKRANTRGRKRRFKNDHLEQMPEVMPSVATEPDTHLFSWDVKGAFKLVGLKLKYIHRFCVDLGPDVDGPRFIVMLVLPFGWLNSPWYWGQVMAEPVRSMRRAGIPTLLYVDDGLNSGRTKEEALENRDVVEAILGDYGIIMARGPDGVPTKGQWEPTQVLDCHTGTKVMVRENQFRLTKEKMIRLRQQSNALLRSMTKHRGRVNASWVARYAGECLSNRRAVQYTRYHCRGMFDAMVSAGVYRTRDYGRMVKVSKRFKDNILFWSRVRSNASISRTIWRAPVQEQWAGDSSGKKFGGLVGAKSLGDVRPGDFNGTPMMRIWSPEIQLEHITMKELRVIEEMLKVYGESVKGKVLRFLEDNMGVVAILSNFSTRSPAMMDILDRIINMLCIWDIELRMLYCDTNNMPADWFSRDANKGDWQLAPAVAEQYIHHWGVCTVDRFADYANALLPRFNAAYPCLGSEALNCYTQDWSHERNYVNAPWGQLGKVFYKLSCEVSAEAVCLVPHWPSAAWWPALAALMDDYIVLHDPQQPELRLSDDAFVPGAMLQMTDQVPEPLRNRGWSLWLVHIPARG